MKWNLIKADSDDSDVKTFLRFSLGGPILVVEYCIFCSAINIISKKNKINNVSTLHE